MKFAAIADIHGNCLALEAVLADMALLGINEAVNLGDHVSGPLEARRTADLLMQHDFPTIRGNHDRWVVLDDPARMAASDTFARRQLDQKHLDWLQSLPSTLTYRDEVFLCHGTPQDDNRYWLERVIDDAVVTASPIEDIELEAAGISASLILCGHSHIPRVVRLRDGRTVVNPGSVGCPGYIDSEPVHHVMQAGTPDASYAIVEKTIAGWSTTFRQVPYDNLAMAELARKNGRNDWASALATGWIS